MRKSFLEQLSYGVGVLAVLLSVILWAANINWVTAANTKEIEFLKITEEQNSKKFEEIRIHLAHIEDAVK